MTTNSQARRPWFRGRFRESLQSESEICADFGPDRHTQDIKEPQVDALTRRRRNASKICCRSVETDSGTAAVRSKSVATVRVQGRCESTGKTHRPELIAQRTVDENM
jgi:hypothetical protein